MLLQPLPEFLYGFMLRKYGLVKVFNIRIQCCLCCSVLSKTQPLLQLAEQHIIEFLASCHKYNGESAKITLFSRFVSLKVCNYVFCREKIVFHSRIIHTGNNTTSFGSLAGGPQGQQINHVATALVCR